MTAASRLVSSVGSPAEVRDRVREAAARKQSLRIVGGGTWLDANRPVRADATLAMDAHSGIIEYEPGDLTLTARAGTTLDGITRTTAVHAQWLALDPPGDPSRATIGATIATASAGPLAHYFGRPRDIMLGIEFVTGAGDIVRGGGRVVKNVAGFDLTRLLTGSWGSLGVLTEVTVRLRALPAVEETLAIDVATSRESLEQARAALQRLPFVPLAAQWVDASVARTLSLGETRPVMLVRLGGNEEAVRAQREQLRALGESHALERDVWYRLRGVEPEQAAVVRLSRLPSLFATTWADGVRLAEQWPHAYCHGDPGRGIVRVVLPVSAETADADLKAVLDAPLNANRVYERLPSALWSVLAPTAIRSRIEREIKSTFDPHSILNPGILGEMQ